MHIIASVDEEKGFNELETSVYILLMLVSFDLYFKW